MPGSGAHQVCPDLGARLLGGCAVTGVANDASASNAGGHAGPRAVCARPLCPGHRKGKEGLRGGQARRHPRWSCLGP
eukprot:13271972-Heterocapsa_arctica.AAC.1